jgi:peptidoglycan/xylan/chitin deacetylase (PgdA/CDA1 family)
MTTDLIARHAKSVVRRGLRQVANALDRPTLVLIYHRVTTLESDPQQLAVRPEHFRAQLRWLERHYRIDRFETPPADDSRRSVVITFDDGYADNCLEALPILEEEGVPATFFVSTGTIGTDREFWWDELERLLRVGDGHPPRLDLPLGEARFTAPTASDGERIAAYDALHPHVKALGPAAREAFLAALARWSGRGTAGRPTHRPMTVDELRRLAASPWVTIGAHTDTHTCLSRLSPSEQLEDIAVSRRKLEAWIGRPVTVFSYPFGGSHDIDEASIQACVDIGFSRVAANWPGTLHRWTDSLQIPRCLVRDWPEAEFAKRLDGFWLE